MKHSESLDRSNPPFLAKHVAGGGLTPKIPMILPQGGPLPVVDGVLRYYPCTVNGLVKGSLVGTGATTPVNRVIDPHLELVTGAHLVYIFTGKKNVSTPIRLQL